MGIDELNLTSIAKVLPCYTMGPGTHWVRMLGACCVFCVFEAYDAMALLQGAGTATIQGHFSNKTIALPRLQTECEDPVVPSQDLWKLGVQLAEASRKYTLDKSLHQLHIVD